MQKPIRQENEEDEMVALASQVGDVNPGVYGEGMGRSVFFVFLERVEVTNQDRICLWVFAGMDWILCYTITICDGTV